ncbi:RcnB family protein [Dyella sp.]|uniref:RcnB family protein n=1 Tax=Dyella sp. TaxID=1869338 RepID=UPI002ED3456B
MKKSLLALAVGSVLAVSSLSASAQDWHDHDRDHHDHDRTVVIEHDRGRREGWYHPGGYVPAEYRGDRYVVNDWHARHLREPPPGYHWVRSDNGDFLLVAVATGVITDLIINSR